MSSEFQTRLGRELSAVGITGRARRRILDEFADHLACDPSAQLGEPAALARQFADEVGSARARRAAVVSFGALALAGSLFGLALVTSDSVFGATPKGGPVIGEIATAVAILFSQVSVRGRDAGRAALGAAPRVRGAAGRRGEGHRASRRGRSDLRHRHHGQPGHGGHRLPPLPALGVGDVRDRRRRRRHRRAAGVAAGALGGGPATAGGRGRRRRHLRRPRRCRAASAGRASVAPGGGGLGCRRRRHHPGRGSGAGRDRRRDARARGRGAVHGWASPPWGATWACGAPAAPPALAARRCAGPSGGRGRAAAARRTSR